MTPSVKVTVTGKDGSQRVFSTLTAASKELGHPIFSLRRWWRLGAPLDTGETLELSLDSEEETQEYYKTALPPDYKGTVVDLVDSDGKISRFNSVQQAANAVGIKRTSFERFYFTRKQLPDGRKIVIYALPERLKTVELYAYKKACQDSKLLSFGVNLIKDGQVVKHFNSITAAMKEVLDLTLYNAGYMWVVGAKTKDGYNIELTHDDPKELETKRRNIIDTELSKSKDNYIVELEHDTHSLYHLTMAEAKRALNTTVYYRVIKAWYTREPINGYTVNIKCLEQHRRALADRVCEVYASCGSPKQAAVKVSKTVTEPPRIKHPASPAVESPSVKPVIIEEKSTTKIGKWFKSLFAKKELNPAPPIERPVEAVKPKSPGFGVNLIKDGQVVKRFTDIREAASSVPDLTRSTVDQLWVLGAKTKEGYTVEVTHDDPERLEAMRQKVLERIENKTRHRYIVELDDGVKPIFNLTPAEALKATNVRFHEQLLKAWYLKETVNGYTIDIKTIDKHRDDLIDFLCGVNVACAAHRDALNGVSRPRPVKESVESPDKPAKPIAQKGRGRPRTVVHHGPVGGFNTEFRRFQRTGKFGTSLIERAAVSNQDQVISKAEYTKDLNIKDIPDNYIWYNDGLPSFAITAIYTSLVRVFDHDKILQASKEYLKVKAGEAPPGGSSIMVFNEMSRVLQTIGIHLSVEERRQFVCDRASWVIKRSIPVPVRWRMYSVEPITMKTVKTSGNPNITMEARAKKTPSTYLQLFTFITHLMVTAGRSEAEGYMSLQRCQVLGLTPDKVQRIMDDIRDFSNRTDDDVTTLDVTDERGFIESFIAAARLNLDDLFKGYLNSHYAFQLAENKHSITLPPTGLYYAPLAPLQRHSAVFPNIVSPSDISLLEEGIRIDRQTWDNKVALLDKLLQCAVDDYSLTKTLRSIDEYYAIAKDAKLV